MLKIQKQFAKRQKTKNLGKSGRGKYAIGSNIDEVEVEIYNNDLETLENPLFGANPFMGKCKFKSYMGTTGLAIQNKNSLHFYELTNYGSKYITE